MRDGDRAVSARAFGVADAFRDAFAGEVGKLFNQPEVLQQRGTAGAGGQRVVIVRHRRACCGGQMLLVGHSTLPT
ncbi:hypothetical protein G6F57_021014 [Rhizopus arrhizus]|nr:hypothetical protein G6F57_021014 [Rhizopus arrhizus]